MDVKYTAVCVLGILILLFVSGCAQQQGGQFVPGKADNSQEIQCRDSGLSCEDKQGIHTISESEHIFCSQNYIAERYYICQRNLCEQTTKQLEYCPSRAEGYVCKDKKCVPSCYVKSMSQNGFDTACYDSRGDEPYTSSAYCDGNTIVYEGYLCINGICEKNIDRRDCSQQGLRCSKVQEGFSCLP